MAESIASAISAEGQHLSVSGYLHSAPSLCRLPHSWNWSTLDFDHLLIARHPSFSNLVELRLLLKRLNVVMHKKIAQHHLHDVDGEEATWTGVSA